MTGIPFVLIFFTISFFSGMPGLFITSSAFNIFSSVCCLSSNCNLILFKFLSVILFDRHPSETNTSYPCCLASNAAPIPLSPAPSMTNLYSFNRSISFTGLRGFFNSLNFYCTSISFTAGLVFQNMGFSNHGFFSKTFHSLVLSDLQCHYRKHHTQDRHDPEPCYNFTFMISQFLIMMMQAGSSEIFFFLLHIFSSCI